MKTSQLGAMVTKQVKCYTGAINTKITYQVKVR